MSDVLSCVLIFADDEVQLLSIDWPKMDGFRATAPGLFDRLRTANYPLDHCPGSRRDGPEDLIYLTFDSEAAAPEVIVHSGMHPGDTKFPMGEASVAFLQWFEEWKQGQSKVAPLGH